LNIDAIELVCGWDEEERYFGVGTSNQDSGRNRPFHIACAMRAIEPKIFRDWPSFTGRGVVSLPGNPVPLLLETLCPAKAETGFAKKEIRKQSAGAG